MATNLRLLDAEAPLKNLECAWSGADNRTRTGVTSSFIAVPKQYRNVIISYDRKRFVGTSDMAQEVQRAENAERVAIDFPERDALLNAWNLFFISRASNPRFDST